MWSDPAWNVASTKLTAQSPLIETGAGSEAESPHEESHVNPCPFLAAGFIAVSWLVGFFDDRFAKVMVLRHPKNCALRVSAIT